MPRPQFQRSKLNRPSRHFHSQSVTSPHSTMPKNNPKTEIESKLLHKSLGARNFDSDDSDRLVTKRPSGRRNRRPEREIYASGAVRGGDVPMSHRSEKAERKKRAKLARTAQEGRLGTSGTSLLQSATALSRRPTLATQSASTLRTTRPVSPELENLPLENLTTKFQRRQPSVLRQKDKDSAHVNLDDEQEFQPDDQSSPLHSRKPAHTAKLSLSSLSRKRKFTDFALSQPLDAPTQPIPSSAKLLKDDAPAELRSPTQKSRIQPPHHWDQATTPEDADSIMAPPESSSPFSSPAKATEPTPAQAKQKAKQQAPPTTADLQAFMPSKRQPSQRPKKQAPSEFDIPADSPEGTSPSISSDEHSTFLLRRNRGKSSLQTKQETTKKPPTSQLKANIKKKMAKAQATRPGTISPLSKRATALGSNARRRTTTKSLPQNTTAATIAATTTTTSTKHSTAKTASAERETEIDAERDKENSRFVSLPRSSTRANGEVDASSNHDLETEGLEGVKTIKDKFAAIDDWDMEFEEVSLDSREAGEGW